uniref:MACPF domain-containing protein n=1 Tax=Palpitomonas bilix TaxID=652834 RepID=A0A7S3G7X4_9EUKA|mmetsp:Transcript_34023/g.87379  ORF Transcript_34023/g.87379 Transcript_34023/m.87379 type:complete len:772 (+) Transcript_34023:155-2470(+)
MGHPCRTRCCTAVVCLAVLSTIATATKPVAGYDDEDRRFNVLPGSAYDPLSDTVNGQLFHFTFNLKKRTPDDSAYLVPDQVQLQRVLKQKVDMVSTVIKTMDEYARSEGSGVEAEGSYRGITASFGSDSENAKESIAEREVALTSTVARVHQYDLIIDPTSSLAERPQLLISTALCALEGGDTVQAEMMLAKLIDEYGAAYLTSVKIGHQAKIVDYITKSYQQSKDHRVLAQEAKLSFFGLFSIGSDSKTTEDSLKQYKQSIEHSYADVVGCGRWVPKMSYEEWSASCSGADALLGGQAFPVHELISSVQFPGIESSVVQKARAITQTLEDRMTALNTYAGCMDPSSPSFSIRNNINDPMACLTADAQKKAFKTYVFGGVYSHCGQGGYCGRSNVFTQHEMCPRDHKKVAIGKHGHITTYACIGDMQGDDVFQYFGGFYSNTAGNPFVGYKKQCPATYAPIRVESEYVDGFDGLTFCLAERGETFKPNHMYNFGGFYTCNEGNIVMKNTMLGEHNQRAAFKCPPGYDNYLAGQITGGQYCPLWMCLDKTEVKVPTIRHTLSSVWKDMPRYGYCHAKEIGEKVRKVRKGDIFLGHPPPSQSPFLLGTKAKPSPAPLFVDSLPAVQSEEIKKVVAFIERTLRKDNDTQPPAEVDIATLGRAAASSQEVGSAKMEVQGGGISDGAVAVLAVACAIAGAGIFVGIAILKPRLAKLRRHHKSSSSPQGGASASPSEEDVGVDDAYARLHSPLSNVHSRDMASNRRRRISSAKSVFQ